MKLRLLSMTLLSMTVFASLTLPSSASTSAYDQMNTVIANVNAEQSFHYSEHLVTTGEQLVNTTDATQNGGRQTITLTSGGKSSTVTVELIAGELYVKGESAILISYMGLTKATADELNNQWFTIPKGNAEYPVVSQGITVSSVASELKMIRGSVRVETPNGLVEGISVITLKGTSVKTPGNPSVPETLYVSQTRKPLPVELSENFKGSVATIVFNRWNETVTLTVPNAKYQLT